MEADLWRGVSADTLNSAQADMARQHRTSESRDSSSVPSILVLLEHYLPGYKSGGPLHAIAGLVEALGNEFNFMIITSDRDLGDDKPYPGIQRDCWTTVGAAAVMYLDRRNPLSVIRRILKTPHDVLYMKSFLSRPFSMWPIWMHALGILRSKSIVIAPSGEFSAGALALNTPRKRIYVAIARWLRIYKGALWHATTQYEAADVEREGPEYAPRVFIASELPHCAAQKTQDGFRRRQKVPSELRVVFVARVARNKNLDGAIRALSNLQGRVWFDIYGPLEDGRYWEECQRLITSLPANVQVRYRGFVPHEEVHGILQNYHLFFLPTQGENFGYSILEALRAGLPILISDRTPWRDLEAAGVGWDVASEQVGRFSELLQKCVEMDALEYHELSARAFAYGLRSSTDPDVVAQSRLLLQTALACSALPTVSRPVARSINT